MYVKVHVFPGAKREKLIQKKEIYELYVKEKAERNLANNRSREVIAEHFRVTKGDVRLLSGHRSHSKLFSVDKSNIGD